MNGTHKRSTVGARESAVSEPGKAPKSVVPTESILVQTSTEVPKHNLAATASESSGNSSLEDTKNLSVSPNATLLDHKPAEATDADDRTYTRSSIAANNSPNLRDAAGADGLRVPAPYYAVLTNGDM